MLRKLSFFALLSVCVSTAAFAQQLPVPRGERGAGFVFSTEGGGGYLGVQTTEISNENYAKFGLSEVRGVAVAKVLENSPAAKAGLQNGDVILRYDGEQISSVRKLMRLIAETAPDHKANLTVWRDGGEREISVTLGKREMPKINLADLNLEDMTAPNLPTRPRTRLPNGAQGMIFRSGERRQIGIGAAPLNPQLADYFGVSNGKGLLVESVRADSPAARAGLKAGDVIVEADGKEISSNTDLIRAINAEKSGDLTLTIIRGKNRQIISVTPETVKDVMMPGFDNFQRFDNFTAPEGFRVITPQSPQMPLTPRIPITPFVRFAPFSTCLF